jgi:competence protein CoiA
MKYALANGQRQEAQPNLSGECPRCGSPVVARCGEVRVQHWAHRGRRLCDPWWENETEWHRAWKDQFPADWQEIVQHVQDGERHIADVETQDGWVIEFQHSNISPDERRSREAFYQGLIWVVDGTRRERDAAQFSRAWASGQSRDPFSSKRRVSLPVGALLRDWAGSHAHVFIDFGDERTLWWLFPESDHRRAYLQYVSRAQFVRIHREKCAHGPSEFDLLVQNFCAFIALYESPPTTPRPRLTKVRPHPNRRPQLIRRGYRL